VYSEAIPFQGYPHLSEQSKDLNRLSDDAAKEKKRPKDSFLNIF
jgi:hypothetical protein